MSSPTSRERRHSGIKRRIQAIDRRLRSSLRVRRRDADQGGAQGARAGLQRLYLAQDERLEAQRSDVWLARDEGAEGCLGVWGKGSGYICFDVSVGRERERQRDLGLKWPF